MLQRDGHDADPKRLKERIALLEVENRNMHAVQNEHAQLQTRFAELERELKACDASSRIESDAGTASSVSGRDAEHAESDRDDLLFQLRWENRLLEKRLKRLTEYSNQLSEDAMRARLQSSRRRRGESGSGSTTSSSCGLQVSSSLAGSGVQDLQRLLSENDASIRHLRGEVRDTATALARNGSNPSKPILSSRTDGSGKKGAVDVLCIGGGSDGQDVEWHAG